jgi:hypothetical protein
VLGASVDIVTVLVLSSTGLSIEIYNSWNLALAKIVASVDAGFELVTCDWILPGVIQFVVLLVRTYSILSCNRCITLLIAVF